MSARRERKAYTERLRSSLMALISIFLRPMVNSRLRRQRASNVEGYSGRRWRGSGLRVVEAEASISLRGAVRDEHDHGTAERFRRPVWAAKVGANMVLSLLQPASYMVLMRDTELYPKLPNS